MTKPTSSELRGNPFLAPTFQQRKDFIFVQERVQPIQSPNSSLWSATTPNSSLSSNITTPQRINKSSTDTSGNTSQSQLNQSISLTPPRNTVLSPTSSIPEIRLPSDHPGRTRVIPVYNPNPPNRSKICEHTYIFALDHETWNPPPTLYGPTNLGDTSKNWSRNRILKTLNLKTRQRNATLNVLATTSLELKFKATIKYDNIFNHPFHATTPSIVTTTTPAPII